jgi:hypothetical protein
MHAGVGAAGALHPHGPALEALDRFLQRLLNRAAVDLALPAGEGRPVVFDDELVAGHGF